MVKMNNKMVIPNKMDNEELFEFEGYPNGRFNITAKVHIIFKQGGLTKWEKYLSFDKTAL